MTPHIWPLMTVLRISIRLPAERLLRIAAQLPKSLLGVGLFQADREFTGIARLFYYSTIAQMSDTYANSGTPVQASKLPGYLHKARAAPAK
jgi:hypothetical protein